jgi:hypothetical protein
MLADKWKVESQKQRDDVTSCNVSLRITQLIAARIVLEVDSQITDRSICLKGRHWAIHYSQFINQNCPSPQSLAPFSKA